MYSATHKMIADIVCGHIRDELGISLDIKAFRYGSIAPDLKIGMRIIKHTRKGSFALVKEIGKALIEKERFTDDKSLKEFSYKLGIIIHFLCDYFCTPHNDEKYKKNIIKHLRYEGMLQNYARREEWNIPALDRAIADKLWNNTSLEMIIVDKTREYNNTSMSFDRDIEFAITVSTMATLNIVKKSIAHNMADKFDISSINFMPA